MTPVSPGCTVRAPMLMEASLTPLRAGTLSVSGAKTMEAGAATPALLAIQTPPPVVPTYRRLPVASEGSRAIAATRPVTRPKSGVWTAVGPRGYQVFADAPL